MEQKCSKKLRDWERINRQFLSFKSLRSLMKSFFFLHHSGEDGIPGVPGFPGLQGLIGPPGAKGEQGNIGNYTCSHDWKTLYADTCTLSLSPSSVESLMTFGDLPG